MASTLIKNVRIINRGQSIYGDVLIKNDRIEKIDTSINLQERADEIDGTDLWLLPGIIDDQVHFREPGLTHKADIASESRAAIAGGVTTFMEMPNTRPPALTVELLEDKYDIAARTSYANYSFFMGTSNDNYDEIMRIDPKNVCGLKIFMGSSTGNMLVDDQNTLDRLFANVPFLIATHCEDEATIHRNIEIFRAKYGDKVTAEMHPLIRSDEGCYLSSSMAVNLAKKHNTRLHILHITTEKEIQLFDNTLPLKDKRITSEVCVHHLFFNESDYATLGNKIKCNPAIKTEKDQSSLFKALLDNHLDIIATDHAPHTAEEKNQPYITAPAGLPLVQHGLNMMVDFVQKGKITIEKVVEKMCHAPVDCFSISARGYIDEGYYADLVLFDPNKNYTINGSNILYKAGWSPLEGKTFKGQVNATFVNGHKVYDGNSHFIQAKGMRLKFDR